MAKEMSLEEVNKYNAEHFDNYLIQAGAARIFGWRIFLLEPGELELMESLERKPHITTSRKSLYDEFFTLSSKFTNLPSEEIGDVLLQGRTLTITPRR